MVRTSNKACSNLSDPGCNCSNKKQEVCGQDGKTYQNPCKAECAGTPLDCVGECPCAPGNIRSKITQDSGSSSLGFENIFRLIDLITFYINHNMIPSNSLVNKSTNSHPRK